jgi:GAF domain-containing protein
MFELDLHIGLISIIASGVIIIAFAYMIVLTEKQRRSRYNLQKSLDKLKKTYDELDEQAKIIVKKDLELNKTQEKLDKKLQGLYTLHKFSKTIRSAFEPEKLFSQIDQSFISELGFDKGLIVLAGTPLSVSVGFDPQQEKRVKKYLKEKNLINEIDQPFLVDKTLPLDGMKKDLLQAFNLASLCIVPIISQQARLGLVVVGNDLEYAQLGEGDLEILSVLAGQIASGLENARLYDEIWQSHRDLEQRVSQRTKELVQRFS